MSSMPFPASGSKCPFSTSHQGLSRSPTGCPVSLPAQDFDPFEASYQADAAEYVRWARNEEPVFYSPVLGYWVITRHDSIKAVFRDNVTFSASIATEKITAPTEQSLAILASYGFSADRTLVNEDEPMHTAKRRVLMEPFITERLKEHEPMVRRLTRQYLDRFIDSGKADLVGQMLWEVPLSVALHFLGVPEEDMETLRECSIAHTLNIWGRPQPEQQAAVAHGVGKFWLLAGKVLEKMRGVTCPVSSDQ